MFNFKELATYVIKCSSGPEPTLWRELNFIAIQCIISRDLFFLFSRALQILAFRYWKLMMANLKYKLCSKGHMLEVWQTRCSICESEAVRKKPLSKAKNAKSSGSKRNCHHCEKNIGGWFSGTSYTCLNTACRGVFCVNCLSGFIFKKCPDCGGKTKP